MNDPLLCLRQAIASGAPVVPTATDALDAPETPLPQAQYLRFGLPSSTTNNNAIVTALDAPTRFHSHDAAVDLRSIYFAWLNREVAIPEYNAAATRLNDELTAAGSTARVHKCAFVERLDLITWLEGASDESEYIRTSTASADAAAAAAAAGAVAASGSAGAAGAAATSAVGSGAGATTATTVTSTPTAAAGTGAAATGDAQTGAGKGAGAYGRSGRGAPAVLDPRLAVIYGGERRMGDHNTALRGIKPTDFSHVRKLAAPFMSKKQQAAVAAAVDKQLRNGGLPHPAALLSLNPKSSSTSSSSAPPGRRPDPIILLSPSASSLLRLSNIKAFLEQGRYVPATNNSGTAATMLHITRAMKDVDAGRPLRFILVEGPEHFKPEYWARVVAVFTTGQTWQFKNYKWNTPAELFKHVLGVYVGWRGEPLPTAIRDWGHRVLQCTVEKWTEPAAAIGGNAAATAETLRWRDREVAESIWKAIETNMRQKGWKRDTGATIG